jgi:biotin carboxyl carrier protein
MRKFNITVNGKTYEVEVEEVSSAATSSENRPSIQKSIVEKRVERFQPKKETKKPQKDLKSVPVPKGGRVISAPMPGNINDIKVKEGEGVKAGAVLLILEAMKMENEIVAPCDATVGKIHVATGSQVNAGDILMVLM